jgi:deoxyribonuclease V
VNKLEENDPLSSESKEFLKELQIKFSELREEREINISGIAHIAGLDVTYTNNKAVGVCIVTNLEGKILERKILRTKAIFPYISGFLFLREAPIMYSLIKRLRIKPDIVFVDGHGIAHPRRSGLAVFVGVLTNLPCIGIAKRLLYGKIGESVLKLGNMNNNYQKIIEPILDLQSEEIIGFKIAKVGEKTYYASSGNIVRTTDILSILSIFNYSYPLCLRLADKISKEEVKRDG